MIKKSVAENTLKAYLKVKAEVIWSNFLNDDPDVSKYAYSDDLFLQNNTIFEKQEAICLFIDYLDNTLKKSRSMIGAIMSALRFLFNACLQDISMFECSGVASARKSLVERGRNSKTKTMVGTTMFITSDMLTWIRQVLDSNCPDYLKQLMICIAIHLGFHFGYRVGEFSISNGDDSHTILNEDVIFETFQGKFVNAVDAKNYCISVIAVCIVILRSSKTNQTGGGDSHILARYSAGSIQLLEDLFAWAQAQSRDPTEMFFFRATPGSTTAGVGYHLRGHEVTAVIKKAANHFGFDTKGFSAKSLRVSAATTMNAERLPEADRMSVTRHASVSSHNMYVRSTMYGRGTLDLAVTSLLTMQDVRRVAITKPRLGGKKISNRRK
jgi:hypothetical protein